MYGYLMNKAFSSLLPVAFVAGTLLVYGSHSGQWSLLLMVVFTLGYTHYIIGGFYQVRAFLTHDHPYPLIVAFIGCVIVSALLIASAHLYGYMWLIAFATIPYFMLHGYGNEITLFERSTGLSAPRAFILSLSLFLTGVTLLAFGHPSAYFNYDLSFLSPFEIALRTDIQQWFGLGGDVLAIVLLASAVGVVGYMSMATPRYHWFYRVLFVAELCVCALLLMGRPNYVFLFFILLAYHFITWALFYGQKFYGQSLCTFRRYCYAHVVIIGGVILAYGLCRIGGVENPHALLFNANIFLFLTTVHITTSFLNDSWCRRLLYGR
jgi:hypothetical protein